MGGSTLQVQTSGHAAAPLNGYTKDEILSAMPTAGTQTARTVQVRVREPFALEARTVLVDQALLHRNTSQVHAIHVTAIKALLLDHGAKDRHGLPRWIALTGHLDTGACGTSYRHARLYRERLGLAPFPITPGLTIPSRSGIERLVHRTRLCHGLPEVKRTWGLGYKALLAELASKKRGDA